MFLSCSKKIRAQIRRNELRFMIKFGTTMYAKLLHNGLSSPKCFGRISCQDFTDISNDCEMWWHVFLQNFQSSSLCLTVEVSRRFENTFSKARVLTFEGALSLIQFYFFPPLIPFLLLHSYLSLDIGRQVWKLVLKISLVILNKVAEIGTMQYTYMIYVSYMILK